MSLPPPPPFRNNTITSCFLFGWGKVAIPQLLHTAPSGLVIYFDHVKNWTRLLNDCATYPVWPSAVDADPHMLVVDEKL